MWAAILGLFASAIGSTAEANIVANPGFESGTMPWTFVTNGAGTFANDALGPDSGYAGHVTITQVGSTVQLRQIGLALEANTQYRLTFRAYSSAGRDVAVSLLQHVAPNANYGLSKSVFDLTNAWQTFTTQFTTRNFTGTVSDARLMFALAAYAANGDEYFFDDVSLTKVPIDEVAPTITSSPVSLTVVEGQTASFSVVASGTNPLSYQWQQNGVDITGATSSSYTTPPVVLTENGSAFRVAVTNAYGSATSNAATLTITPKASSPGQFLLLDRTFDYTTSYSAALLGETPSSTNPNCIRVQGIYKTVGQTASNVCNHEAFKYFQMPSNNPASWTSPVDYSTGTLYQRLEVIAKPSATPVLFALCMFQDQVISSRHACGNLNKLSFTAPGTYFSSQPMTKLYQYTTAIDWTRKPHVIMLHITDANRVQPDSYASYMDKWFGTPNWGLYYPMRVRFTAIIVPPGGGAPVWPN